MPHPGLSLVGRLADLAVKLVEPVELRLVGLVHGRLPRKSNPPEYRFRMV